jgi:hypothetical protein
MMSDTFDPYDENDSFDAASLNTRFASMKDKVNSVPVSANQAQALGPSHVGGIIDAGRTNTTILKPKNAVTAEAYGTAWYCEDINSRYPGWGVEDFETGGSHDWQRISDISRGYREYLSVNITGVELGVNKRNAVLVFGNVEFVCIYTRDTDLPTASAGASLVTIITTVSSSGVRTFYWDTLRTTSMVNYIAGKQNFSIDIPHRTLLKTDGADIKEVKILASCLNDYDSSARSTGAYTALVRFCQLTAVALQTKVN